MANTAAELENMEIQRIMGSEGGRSLMWNLLEQAGTFGSIYDGDTIKHAYNSGMRDFGVRLQNRIIEAAPDNYLRMLKEKLTDG